MKKRTEKHIVDDLFARKLENMSLPPSPDEFARLQARMGQGEPETRVVFWRNPASHRYMAIAASLLLVCLFGWLYLSTETPATGGKRVAINKSAASPVQDHIREQLDLNPGTKVVAAQSSPDELIPSSTDLKTTNSPSAKDNGRAVGKQITDNRRLARIDQTTLEAKTSSQSVPILALTKSTEPVVETHVNTPSAKPTAEEEMTAMTSKPAPVAERVLIVTINEPATLLAARQTVEPSGEKDVVVAVDEPEKEIKAVNLWRQVKRIKQGEIFARKDAGDEERGLLGRAYSGLKQTFDKDKSAKQ